MPSPWLSDMPYITGDARSGVLQRLKDTSILMEIFVFSGIFFF